MSPGSALRCAGGARATDLRARARRGAAQHASAVAKRSDWVETYDPVCVCVFVYVCARTRACPCERVSERVRLGVIYAKKSWCSWWETLVAAPSVQCHGPRGAT
jgi:hypothetical protein